MGPRRAAWSICRYGEGGCDCDGGGCPFVFGSHQAHRDLATAGQLDIDLRQKLGIQQRAVENTVTAIDSVA